MLTLSMQIFKIKHVFKNFDGLGQRAQNFAGLNMISVFLEQFLITCRQLLIRNKEKK